MKHIHGVRDDGVGLEAGASSLAGLNGQEVATGTSDGTGTVVAVLLAAVLALEDTGHGGGSEREDSDDLHLDG